jgi:hypothetical protein
VRWGLKVEQRAKTGGWFARHFIDPNCKAFYPIRLIRYCWCPKHCSDKELEKRKVVRKTLTLHIRDFWCWHFAVMVQTPWWQFIYRADKKCFNLMLRRTETLTRNWCTHTHTHTHTYTYTHKNKHANIHTHTHTHAHTHTHTHTNTHTHTHTHTRTRRLLAIPTPLLLHCNTTGRQLWHHWNTIATQL